jgi:hypothetical protein
MSEMGFNFNEAINLAAQLTQWTHPGPVICSFCLLAGPTHCLVEPAALF